MLLVQFSEAQNRFVSPYQEIKFENLTTRDGLTDNTIWAIAQDHQGFMWFATENGLNKYDGYKFTNFKYEPGNPNALTDARIYDLLVDQQGYIWLATFGGLQKFDPITETFKTYRNRVGDDTTLGSDQVIALAETGDGTIWVGTYGGGLNKFNPESETFKRYLHDPNDANSLSDPENFVRSILQDSYGFLWIGTGIGGVNRFDTQTETFKVFYYDPLADNSIGSDSIAPILQDSKDRIWIGTQEGGLNRYNPSTQDFTRYLYSSSNENSLPSDWVFALCEDMTGNLWVGTDQGLTLYDPIANTFLTYTEDDLNPNALVSNWILSIFQDASGVIWIGTTKGISKFKPYHNPFIHIHKDPNLKNTLSEDNIMAITKGADGIVWLGTDGGGLTQYNQQNGTFENYLYDPTNPTGLTSPSVLSLLVDKHSILWVGTSDSNGEGGLLRHAGNGVFRKFLHDPSDENSISGNGISVIFEDNNGTMWVGTLRDGLNRFNAETNTFTRFLSDEENMNSLSSNEITSMCQDVNGLLWVGTYSAGLNRLNPESGVAIRYYHQSKAGTMSSNTVYDVHCEESGKVWVGTNNGLHLYRAKTNDFIRFTTDDGLASNDVYGILEDSAGRLWLSSEKGLTQFDFENNYIRRFTYEDGLQGNQFNQGARYASEEGALYFGGVNGFNTFFPLDISTSSYIPPIRITDVRVKGKSYKDQIKNNTLQLSYQDYYVEIEFASLDYSYPQKNQYRYKLSGVDDEWIPRDADRRIATYTNLGGGTFNFSVQGSNSDGVWNEEVATLKIVVEPPLWRKPWFIGLMLLLLVGGGYLFINRRMEQLKQQREEEIEIKQRLAESREAERLHIAQELHDGPMQDLHGVTYLLEAMEFAPHIAKSETVSGIKDSVHQVNDELRALCGELRPPSLAPFGLAKALRAHARRFKEKNPHLNIWLDVTDDDQLFPEEVRMALFRIYQASLGNVVQHSEARNVWVTFNFDKSNIMLQVQDDGKGFEQPKRWVEFGRQSHYGLLGASERAESVGGRMTVKSAIGQGTWVGVTIPRELEKRKPTIREVLWQS